MYLPCELRGDWLFCFFFFVVNLLYYYFVVAVLFEGKSKLVNHYFFG